MRSVLVAMAMLLAAGLHAGEITGTVTNEDAPLPGTTITLIPAAGDERVTISNEQGQFRFAALPNGRYEIRYELAGLETVERTVYVDGKVALPAQELRLAPIQQVTIMSCNISSCQDDLPRSKFDRPLCVDESLNTSLIESVERGDRSALALLQQRYRTADTYQERNRIGGVLLRHLDDDAIWQELSTDAEVAVRFPRDDDGGFTPELEAYCEARNVEPENLWWMSWSAFVEISGEVRARPLLYRALETSDRDLVFVGIAGLAAQRDATALPAIDRALERLEADRASDLVKVLETFESPEAMALLAKYRKE